MQLELVQLIYSIIFTFSHRLLFYCRIFIVLSLTNPFLLVRTNVDRTLSASIPNMSHSNGEFDSTLETLLVRR